MNRDPARTPWLWPSLVSVDAPLVAVAWQALFARTFHAHVPLAARVALFTTTWAVYLADRLWDACSLGEERSLRQAFAARHARAGVIVLASLAAVDAVAILRGLDRRVITIGAVVGAAVVTYVAANHASHRAWARLPVKELIVGSLFAVGTVASFAEASPSFVGSALLFAALCTLDCVAIAAWERPLDLVQRKTSIATRFSWSTRAIVPGAVALVAASLFVPQLVGAVVTGCAIVLALLHRSSLRPDEKVALADLALTAPLVVLACR